MDDIVNSVNKVSDTVHSISDSAQVQSAGMAEVNTAIRHLETMARQNEETVDLAKAASVTLQQQASALTEAVAVFKL
jgi:methyl-accepting chemotaxis protein